MAAVIALVAGLVEQFLGIAENGWIDGVAIIVACLIVAVVTVTCSQQANTNLIQSTNDYVKDLQFRKLREDTDKKKLVRVIREDEEHQVD